MAGDPTRASVEAFLSRLTKSDAIAGGPLALSSAQKAAFRAWVRANGIPIDLSLLNARTVTLDRLLGGRTADPAPTAAPANEHGPPPAGPDYGGVDIGVDIEEEASLPQAADYRTHEFYVENFADAEIAYCILQPRPRLSFCGLWAAKEALIKAGAATGPEGGLRDIRITHDEAGKPRHPGSSLSISHTDRTAIAIAVFHGQTPASRPPGPEDARPVDEGQVRRRLPGPGRWAQLLAAVLAGMAGGYLFGLLSGGL